MANVPLYSELPGEGIPNPAKGGKKYKIYLGKNSQGAHGIWHVYYDRDQTVFIGPKDAVTPAAAVTPPPAPAAAPAPDPAPAPPAVELNINHTTQPGGAMFVNNTGNKRSGQQYIIEQAPEKGGKWHVYLDDKGAETRRVFVKTGGTSSNGSSTSNPDGQSDGNVLVSTGLEQTGPAKGLAPTTPSQDGSGGTVAPSPEYLQKAQEFQNRMDSQGQQTDKTTADTSAQTRRDAALADAKNTAAAGGIYTVRSGDTLSEIAAEHGTTVSAIKSANAGKIEDVNDIKIGWTIKIPTGSTYPPSNQATPSDTNPNQASGSGDTRPPQSPERVAMGGGNPEVTTPFDGSKKNKPESLSGGGGDG